MPGEEKFFIAMMVEAYQMKKEKKKKKNLPQSIVKTKKKNNKKFVFYDSLWIPPDTQFAVLLHNTPKNAGIVVNM